MAQFAELILDFSGGLVDGDYLEWDQDGTTVRFTAKDSPSAQYEFNTSGTASGAANEFASIVSALTDNVVSQPTSTRVSIKAKYYGDRWNITNFFFAHFIEGGGFGPLFNVSMISNVANVTLAMSIAAVVTQNQCFGLANGAIDLTITGGEWPFQIDWRILGNPAIISNDEDLIDLIAANYEVTVTDNAATVLVDDWIITEPASSISGVPTLVMIDCNGAGNGSISLVVGGGTPGYTYEWSHGPTTKDVTGLTPGNYSVTITDGLGCKLILSNLLITQPPVLTIEAITYGYSIVLNVSGGTPGYTYLWSHGPTTKDVNNLTPDDYTVTVTDANGCALIINITISLLRFFFSHNAIPMVLIADAPETKPNLSFINEVWVEQVYGSDNYDKIATEEHPSDDAAGTVFRGETFLDAFLKPHVPAYSLSDIELAEELFKRFYYRHTEKFGTPPVAAAYIQMDTNFVLLGGLSDLEFAAANFQSYFETNKPFLNWEKAKVVLPTQPDYLYYAVNATTITLVKVMAEVFFTDGTSEIVAIYSKDGVASIFEVYCFPCGYDQLGLGDVDPTKVVERYNVWMVNQLDVPVSEVRSFEVDWDYYPYVRFLMYQSALGGMSTIALTGKARKKVTVKHQLIEQFLPYNFGIEDIGEKVSYSSGRSVIRFSSGYITDSDYFERLEDLIRSEVYFLLDESGTTPRWIPVRVDADATPVYDETRQDALNVLTGNIYLHEDRKYTPGL